MPPKESNAISSGRAASVATPPKAVTPKVVPKQVAPVVEKPKVVTPAPVAAPAPAPAPAPVAAPQAAPVVPPQAAPVVEAPRAAPAPIADASSANVRESRTQNYMSGGLGVNPGPSIASRVGNFLADYGKAAMSPLTEMAVIPAAQGITQGYANQKVAATGVDVSRSPQVTISAEAKNKLNPFVDPVTGKVDRTSQALTGASIVGGAAAGAAVGKYVLPKVTQAISNKVSRMADIPDPIAKFQNPVGNTAARADDELFDRFTARQNISTVSDYLQSSKSNLAPTWQKLDPINFKPPASAPYDPYAKSVAQKTKATLAAGLTAATSSPANAGARAVIQDVGVVPRSSIGRITSEFGAGPKTNTVTANGRQFTLDMPKTAFASNRPVLTQTGPNSFTASQAAAKASRIAATEASRSAARASIGVRAGAATSGYASSSIPDSGIAAISNNAAANSAANSAAANTIKKVTQPSTADRIAQTRAEDLAPVINAVKNPFNNSVTGSTSTSNVSNPNPPEGPTKYSPPIPLDNFKGGVGQQDVLLKKVF